jgi:hypothetical protein
MGMGDSVELLFKIKADSSSAQSDIKKLRSVFEAETKAIERFGSDTFLKLGNSIGLTGGQMAGLAKAAPIAGAAIAAVAGTVAGLAAGLLSLVKATSDYGSAIHDSAEKTGLSTGFLSAYKLAADQSSGSMADLETAVKFFSKTVADAARGSDEAKDKLRRLGIDPQEAIKDLEGALAKAFKTIHDAPEGIEQTSAATDAFSRSGANLITTIKSFNGDVSEMIKRAKEVGAILSKEDAEAADKFGDTLDTLSVQIRGVGYAVAREFMPQIQSGMESASQFVKDNQETFRRWGRNLSELIGGAVTPMRTALGGLSASLNSNAVDWKQLGEGMGFWAAQAVTVGKGIAAIGNDLAWLGVQISHVVEGWKYMLELSAPMGDEGVSGMPQQWTAPKRSINPLNIPFGFNNPFSSEALARAQTQAPPPPASKKSNYDIGQTSKGAGGGADKARQERIRQLEEEVKRAEQIYKDETEAAKREYRLRETSLREHTGRMIQLENDRFTKEEAILNRKLAEAKEQSERDKAQDEIDEKRRARDRNILNLQDDQNQKELDAAQAHAAALMSLQEDFGKRQIESIQKLAESGHITYEQAANDEYQIELDLFNRKREMLALEEEAAGRDLELKQKINDEITKLLAERIAATVEHGRKVAEAQQKDLERTQKYLDSLYNAEKRYQAKDKELERDRLQRILTSNTTTRAQKQFAISELARLALIEIGNRERAEIRELEIQRDSELALEKHYEKKKLITETYKALIQRIKDGYTQQKQDVSTEATADSAAQNPMSAQSLFGSTFAATFAETGSIIQSVGATALDMFNKLSASAGNFGTIAYGAFSAFAQGLGSVVQGLILTGTTGPAALKKLTAAVLAQVAVQALVKGVYELGAGFAALFFNPAEAAAHFQASGFYFAAAALAGGAGRAVAGNSFSQSANTAGQGAQASGFGGGSNSASNNPQARQIEQDRNQSARGELPLHVEFGRAVTALQSAADAVRNVVSRVALDLNIKTDERHEAELVSKHLDGALSHSYRNNGKLRELILQGVNE